MILLTRPFAQSTALAQILGEENCIIAPMMEIAQLEFKIPKHYQAIISTSKNVEHEADIKIPTHGKNAEEILQYCLNKLTRDGGKIIYLSGDDITLDIAAKLREQGFDAERVVAYEQVPTNKLDADLQEINIATFFSLNSLKNFDKLAGNQSLADISCICISEKVAKFAKKMSWKKIYTAHEPNLSGMIDAINKAAY